MPKGAAWRTAARRRDYEKHTEWIRFRNLRAYYIYIEEHGHPYRPPGRKATCQRYEDRRRKARARKRHLRRIDNLPQAIERERRIAASIADDARLQAEYVAAVEARRDLNDRRGALGLNALPDVDKPRTGLGPGAIGRIRRF